MSQLPRRAAVLGYLSLFLIVLFACTSYTYGAGWTLSNAAWSTHQTILDIEGCFQDQSQRLGEARPAIDDAPSLPPVRRHNVAIASVFGHHFDVYMALAWTFERVQARTSDLRLRVFADAFHHGFEAIVEELGIYKGERHPTDQLLESMSQTNGDVVDLLILGTCEIDLRSLHEQLLSTWDERPQDEKFSLVCMVHNVHDTAWQVHIPEWSRRGALRILTLGNHVSVAFKNKFDELSVSSDSSIHTVGYESIPVDAHYPVLDIPYLPSKSLNRTLSKAVIQGSFDPNRRDYTSLFGDLIASMHEDPAVWGYLFLEGHTSFLPDPEATVPPFQLALVGSGWIEVPEELAYVVTVHRDLDYEEFYRIIAGMDIVVPAFIDYGYYSSQASSTIALAVELDVPILATQRMRTAYQYIDDDRVVVTRPAAMREVHALKALRTGDASSFLRSDPLNQGHSMSSIRGMTKGVEKMLSNGWIRDKTDLNGYKRWLWASNEAVAQRLIRDA